MSIFRIRYECPVSGERREVVAAFDDWTGHPNDDPKLPVETISAEDWAKDYGYTLADKGWHEVENIDHVIKAMYESGKTVSQVAQIWKVGRAAVRAVVQ